MKLPTSERIKYITESSNFVWKKPNNEIKVILDAFGILNLTNYTSSSIMEAVQTVSDEVLFDLAEHCGVVVNYALKGSSKHEEANEGKLPDYWEAGKFKVFLSHISKKQRFAGDLQEELAKYGLKCFVAHKDVKPTKKWQEEIEQGLLTCDALIALLHPGFHESNWTDQEIGYVMGQGKPTFTVRLGEDPYGFIGKFQAFFGQDKTVVELAKEIVFGLCENDQTKTLMASVLTGLMVKSDSFATSSLLIGPLEQLDNLSVNQKKLLKKALSSNSQISGEYSNRVPKRLQEIIK